MTLRRIRLAALLLPLLAGCGDTPSGTGAEDPPPDFITVRRPWRPGERDSVIARIIATRAFSFPYVGDISDDAPILVPVDSATDIVPNPDLGARRSARDGPLFSVLATVPSAGWTIVGLRVRLENTNQGGDLYRWLGYFFYNNAEPTWKGYVLGSTGAAAVNAIVNTPAFDAANAQNGAGGGEARQSTGTYWQANGLGTPNRLRVTASSFAGTTTTLTTGPFLGGTLTNGTMTGSISQVVLTRVLGSGGTAQDTVNLGASSITAYYYQCVFPTPCTTNVLMAPQVRARLER